MNSLKCDDLNYLHFYSVLRMFPLRYLHLCEFGLGKGFGKPQKTGARVVLKPSGTSPDATVVGEKLVVALPLVGDGSFKVVGGEQFYPSGTSPDATFGRVLPSTV